MAMAYGVTVDSDMIIRIQIDDSCAVVEIA